MVKYQETKQDRYVKATLKKTELIMVKILPLLQDWNVLGLSYAKHKGFKVYEMDVKSAFLNVILDEEVCIE